MPWGFLRDLALVAIGLALYVLLMIGLARFCGSSWHPDGHHGRREE